MNNIMSYFCFLSVQTVNFCGHIARYGQWSYTPSASLLPRFAGERNPYQLTFCPRNKFKNLTVGIIRTHLLRMMINKKKSSALSYVTLCISLSCFILW